MKIATATYPIDWHDDWTSYEVKITAWVAEAANAGAGLLVFPEYGAMELASLSGVEIAANVEASMRAVDRLRGRVDDLYAALAAEHNVHILGASAPCFESERPTNRAVFFAPNGKRAHQDKQIMTRYERSPMNAQKGDPLTVFDTDIGKLGVIICYDSEFPILARVLIEAGVEILLVPSCTGALAGYWRVRIGAMARALESQCVVVHSPTTGDAFWNPIVETNVGAAAIYGPPDIGFPDTGVIAAGALNKPGWVYGDVSLDVIRAVRADGKVLNKTHWEEQTACTRTNIVAIRSV